MEKYGPLIEPKGIVVLSFALAVLILERVFPAVRPLAAAHLASLSNRVRRLFKNVSLAAAALSAIIPPSAPIPPQPPTLLNSTMQSGVFTFSFSTETNHTYAVEWTDALDPAFWQALTNFPGDGTMATITDGPAGAGARFYRVKAQ